MYFKLIRFVCQIVKRTEMILCQISPVNFADDARPATVNVYAVLVTYASKMRLAKSTLNYLKISILLCARAVWWRCSYLTFSSMFVVGEIIAEI